MELLMERTVARVAGEVARMAGGVHANQIRSEEAARTANLDSLVAASPQVSSKAKRIQAASIITNNGKHFQRSEEGVRSHFASPSPFADASPSGVFPSVFMRTSLSRRVSGPSRPVPSHLLSPTPPHTFRLPAPEGEISPAMKAKLACLQDAQIRELQHLERNRGDYPGATARLVQHLTGAASSTLPRFCVYHRA